MSSGLENGSIENPISQQKGTEPNPENHQEAQNKLSESARSHADEGNAVPKLYDAAKRAVYCAWKHRPDAESNSCPWNLGVGYRRHLGIDYRKQ